jgi:hypothetical protein
LDKTAIYVINSGVDKEILSALAKEFDVSPNTELPDWLKESYDDPATADSEAGLKYQPATDVLVILGEDANE